MFANLSTFAKVPYVKTFWSPHILDRITYNENSIITRNRRGNEPVALLISTFFFFSNPVLLFCFSRLPSEGKGKEVFCLPDNPPTLNGFWVRSV